MTERSIFQSALDLRDPPTRAAYLDRVCGHDPALRDRVEALLAAAQRTGGFMEKPARDLPSTMDVVGATAAYETAAPRVVRVPAEPDTRDLVWRHLRRAVLLLLILGTPGTVIRVWWFFHMAQFGVDVDLRRFQLVAAIAVYLVIVGISLYVFRGKSPSLAGLRRDEVALFGLIALNMAANQYVVSQSGELAQFARYGTGAVSYRALGWAAINAFVIVVYGMYMPNTARRSALVTGGMAAVCLTASAAAVIGHGYDPEVVRVAIIVPVYVLAASVGVAVYGAQRITSYRRAAAEARRLGPYTLVRKLGAGGMGEVHLAEHRLLKRPCAVKLIRPEKAGDDTAVRRFEREVEAATRLSHPAAVQVYDFGRSDDGALYYVMEYVPGLTLDGVVARSGPLPAGRVVHVLRQACGALAEAHAVGLVHRDVKPSNLMLGRFGGRADAVKLLDFGLVSVGDDQGDRLTHAGGVMGTPAYMSPEQARGAVAGPGADLYSLGAVGYFLLTGRPPFVGENMLELLHAHQNAVVIPPSASNAAVPADLESVVIRCLAKGPADRFPTAGDLNASLAACGCATEWTDADAADWWDEVERDSKETPGGL